MKLDGANVNGQDAHFQANRDVLSGLRNRVHFYRITHNQLLKKVKRRDLNLGKVTLYQLDEF
ncbi:hypothetical protein [Vibrio sp. MACH09]|uniref:hypothetical protein n=1 Tax=Vibrio sp. MACH09 TaxID=3025122 RepID=UPI00295E70F6|nr:hypothetical protein [Vibrio sp. MACH09]